MEVITTAEMPKEEMVNLILDLKFENVAQKIQIESLFNLLIEKNILSEEVINEYHVQIMDSLIESFDNADVQSTEVVEFLNRYLGL